MDKVSIITPVRNAATWLNECIDSVFGQSHTNWEWILVDDHSADNTMAVLNAQSDDRIVVLRNEGEGIIDALGMAYRACSGDYITRMDADDIMPPERLKLMVQLLKSSPKKTVVTGKVAYFSDSGVSKGYLKYQDWLNKVNTQGQQWPNIYRECVVASPNWLVRLSDLQAIGGFENLAYPEDYDLTFNWYKYKFQVRCIDDVTLLWREHPQRTSRTSENYAQESFFNLKIKRFVELDYASGPLVIWGNNIKSTLTQNILRKHNLDPIVSELTDYQSIELLDKPQLLIAVYPDTKHQQEIIEYLDRIGLKQGKDWWWL